MQMDSEMMSWPAARISLAFWATAIVAAGLICATRLETLNGKMEPQFVDWPIGTDEVGRSLSYQFCGCGKGETENGKAPFVYRLPSPVYLVK